MISSRIHIRIAFLYLAIVLVSMGCPSKSSNNPPPPPPVTDLNVTPASGLTSSGIQGGPFSPSSVSYALENTGRSSLSWTAVKTQSWVNLSSAGGTLGAGQSTQVTASINSTANSLAIGTYGDIVTFTNTTSGSGNTTRSVGLSITPNPNPLCTGLRTFNGGALGDLKALCPSLNFDELEITGGLILPDSAVSSVLTTITANKLTITSTGSIGYLWYGGSYYGAPNDCKWVPAPSLALKVSGNVVIDGNIDLEGRYGVSINSIYEPCKWCNGMNGGDVTITGNTIKLTSKVTNSGGDGALETQFGNHCKSGDSGNLKLETVTTMDLSGATIINQRGVGMDPSKNGYSGTANIAAGGIFTMRDGNIDSSGAMTFSAASTDIWGTIHYGTLNETIGGAKDTTNPTVSVLSSKITATYSENTEVKVQASDVGMGLRGVRLQGLGSDTTYDIADCGPGSALCTASALDSKLTMSFYVNDMTSPNTLQVIAIDNKGNTTTVPVTGIMIGYPAEIEPNENPPDLQAQTLKLYGGIQGNIQNGDAAWVFGPGSDPIFANKNGEFRMEDWYKITCCEEWTTPAYSYNKCNGEYNSIGEAYTCCGIRISVDFSGSASVYPNLNAYLWDNTGLSWAQSTKNNVMLNDYIEQLLLQRGIVLTQYYYAGYCPDMGDTWYVSVQAWDVPMRAIYKIKYGQ